VKKDFPAFFSLEGTKAESEVPIIIYGVIDDDSSACYFTSTI